MLSFIFLGEHEAIDREASLAGVQLYHSRLSAVVNWRVCFYNSVCRFDSCARSSFQQFYWLIKYS